ncbi:MAG: hypothetical protein R3272_14850 [Candidatus Promineifilaceae bacterium]|nr:hypothetical protein [Candidatus Promineifilaceae bacterium]
MKDQSHEQVQPLLAIYRDLDRAQQRRVEAHVEQCAACAQELRDFQAMDRQLAELRERQRRRFRDRRPDAAELLARIGRAGGSSAPRRRFLAPLAAPLRLATAAAAVLAFVAIVGLFALWIDAVSEGGPNGLNAPLATGERSEVSQRTRSEAVAAERRAVITAHDVGLTVEASLSQESYRAGEAGQVDVIFVNKGDQVLTIAGSCLELVCVELRDEQGQVLATRPGQPLSMRGERGGSPSFYSLARGEALTTTVAFQVPVEEALAGGRVTLWLSTGYGGSREGAEPGTFIIPDDDWRSLRLSLPMQILPAVPSDTPLFTTMAREVDAVPPPVTPTPLSASDFPHHQDALLVAPADDLPIPQAEFTRLGIEVVPTFDVLGARGERETVKIIYFHPAAFRSIDRESLRALYDNGILIVVLDVPASEISAKVGVLSGYEDLRPETFADSELFVAAAFQNQDDLTPTGGARWAHRDFYRVDQWWMLVHNVEFELRQRLAALTATPTLPPEQAATRDALLAGLTASPTATRVAGGREAGACSSVPRPALLLARQVDADNLILTVREPLGGAECTLSTDADYSAGALATAGETLYYPVRDRQSGTITIWEHPLDGAPAPLAVTTTPALGSLWFGLHVSTAGGGGTQVVWATFDEIDDGRSARFWSSVWMADLQTGTRQLLWEEEGGGTLPPSIEPLHLAVEENALYFARTPYGIGGIGPFRGRYSGLYRLPLEGPGAPEAVFACPPEFDLCLNDADFERRLVAAVVEAGEQLELRIVDFDGAVVARHAPRDGDFLGEPIFGPDGDVAFVAATVESAEDGTPVYRPGAIRLWPAPYADEPRTLVEASGPHFGLWYWFGDSQLLAGDWADGAGLALLGVDGTRIVIPQSGRSLPVGVLQSGQP